MERPCECGSGVIYDGRVACKACFNQSFAMTCEGECGTVFDILPFHDDFGEGKKWPKDWTCNECCSSSDDEVEVVHVRPSTVCPITQGDLAGAAAKKSSVCGHVYSAKGIQQYLKMHMGKTMCPVSGCNRRIKTSFLEQTLVNAPCAKKKRKVVVITIDDDSE